MPNRWFLKQAERQTVKIARFGLERFAEIVKKEVQKGVAKSVADSVEVVFGLQRIKIVAKHKAAAFIEFGTPPHRIEPTKSHGLLVFAADGETVFVKGGVDHPGTKPNPFMRRGVKRAVSKVKKAFK